LRLFLKLLPSRVLWYLEIINGWVLTETGRAIQFMFDMVVAENNAALIEVVAKDLGVSLQEFKDWYEKR
jgi:hypothetical protein